MVSKKTCRKLVLVLLSLSMADVARKVCHLLKGTVMQLCTRVGRGVEI